jgi:hypothetical protein
MLTLKTCFDAIDHKLGIDDVQPLDRLNIVNQAGAILYSQPWRWLEGGAWTLSLDAGSDRIPLPADAGELVDAVATDGYSLCVQLVSSYGDLLAAKSLYPDGVSGSVVMLAPFVEQRDNQLRSYLAVWPTQSAALPNAILARGRRCWAQMRDDMKPEGAIVPLPPLQPIFETLFIELLRAYAAGYEKDGTTDVQAEIARVMAGPLWLAAQNADVRAVGGSSALQNTALQMARAHNGGYDGDVYNGPQVWA